MLLDAITFHWIGDRFLSPAMWRVVTDLRPVLSGQVTVNVVAAVAIALLGCSVSIALACWTAERIAAAWAAETEAVGADADIRCLPRSCRTLFNFLAGRLPAISSGNGKGFFQAPVLCDRFGTFSRRRCAQSPVPTIQPRSDRSNQPSSLAITSNASLRLIVPHPIILGCPMY